MTATTASAVASVHDADSVQDIEEIEVIAADSPLESGFYVEDEAEQHEEVHEDVESLNVGEPGPATSASGSSGARDGNERANFRLQFPFDSPTRTVGPQRTSLFTEAVGAGARPPTIPMVPGRVGMPNAAIPNVGNGLDDRSDVSMGVANHPEVYGNNPVAASRQYAVSSPHTLPKRPKFDGEITSAYLRQCRHEYRSYWEETMAMATANFIPYVAPISQCFEYDTRRVLAWMLWGKQSHEVCEADWADWMAQAYAQDRETVDLKAAESLLKQVKMPVVPMDLMSGVTTYQVNLLKKLSELNLEYLIQEEPKLICDVMVAAIKPKKVYRLIKNELNRKVHKDFMKNVWQCSNFIRNYCMNVQKYMTREDYNDVADTTSSGSRGNGSSGSGGGSTNGSNGGRTSGSGVASNRTRDAGSRGSTGNKGPVSASSGNSGKGPAPARGGSATGGASANVNATNTKPKHACLKCKSTDHKVRDCPDCTPEESEKLWAEHRKTFVRNITTEGARGALADKSNFTCIVDGVLSVEKNLADSGSKTSIATVGTISTLLAAGANPVVTTVEEPMKLYPYGTDAKPIICNRRVRFKTIEINTNEGPLMLRSVSCWIDETSTKPFLLLGLPVMSALGFSAESLMTRARTLHKDWDMSKIDASVGSSCYQLRELSSVCDDFDDDDGLECATPMVKPVDHEKLREVVLTKARLNATKANLPETHLTRLEEILLKYIDCFRIEFAADPPVKVKPLLVRKKAGPVQLNVAIAVTRHCMQLICVNMLLI